MVSVDQVYMIGHMKNADGSINNKNVVLSAACEAAELFQCMMSVNQKLEDWQRFNHTLEMHLRSVECEKIHDICQAVYGMKHPSDELEGLYLAREDEQIMMKKKLLIVLLNQNMEDCIGRGILVNIQGKDM